MFLGLILFTNCVKAQQESKQVACRNAAGYRIAGFGINYDDIDAVTAIAICRDAIAESPENLSLLAYLARALQRKGDGVSLTEALTASRRAAEAGDAEGQTRLGNLLATDDPAAAVSLYSQAARINFAPAQFALAMAYAGGNGVVKNDEESLKLVLDAVAADYGPALHYLAQLHREKKVPNSSPIEERRLLERAASQSYTPAMFELAYEVAHGQGGQRDLDRALELYRQVVKRGGPDAQKSTYWINKIETISADLGRLKKASDNGTSSAILALAMFYCQGDSTQSDDNLCLDGVERAADVERANGKAPTPALLELAKLYRYGRGKILKASKQKWLESLRIAGNLGDGRAAIQLGEVYASGEGVLKSEDEATLWFKRAGESEQVEGVINAAEKFLRGDEVARNPSLAILYYERAGTLGSSSALLTLARELTSGEQLPQDIDRGLAIFEHASDAGNAAASQALAEIFASGTGGLKKDEVRATAYFRHAAEQGERNAMRKVAQRLAAGIGASKSISEAADWLAKSLESDEYAYPSVNIEFDPRKIFLAKPRDEFAEVVIELGRRGFRNLHLVGAWRLANGYIEGKGPQDAYDYLKEARRQGLDDSSYALARLLDVFGDQISCDEALNSRACLSARANCSSAVRSQ